MKKEAKWEKIYNEPRKGVSAKHLEARTPGLTTT